MEASHSCPRDEDSCSPDNYALDKILDEKKEVEASIGGVNYRISRGDDSVSYAYLLTADNGKAIYYELGNGLRLKRAVNGSGGEEVAVRQESINAIVNKIIYLNPDY